MSKFIVQVDVSYSINIDVDANNEEEAKNRCFSMISNKGLSKYEDDIYAYRFEISNATLDTYQVDTEEKKP